MNKTEIVLAIIAIIVSILGVVASIIMFRVGVRQGRREREEDSIAAAARDADRRVDQVVQAYTELVNSGYTNALHGLLMAGIKNLRSSEEVRLRARELLPGRPAIPCVGIASKTPS